MSESTTPGSALAKAAGTSLMVIAVVHTVFTTTPHWSGWMVGELRDRTAPPDSVAAFWAQPGGFGVIMLLLGLLIVHMERRGTRVPAVVGWTILAWVALCVFLIGVSGFILGLVPATLLIAADLKARRARA